MREAVCVAIKQKETGRKIRKLMVENGYSVRDIQEMMGFESPRSVYKWLAGDSLPTVDNLLILSRILHTNMESILVYDGDFLYIGLRKSGISDQNIVTQESIKKQRCERFRMYLECYSFERLFVRNRFFESDEDALDTLFEKLELLGYVEKEATLKLATRYADACRFL